MNLEKYIAIVPDFPIEGIFFRDITPLLLNPQAFKEAINKMSEFCLQQKPDIILGIDARGFIFATAIAFNINKPLGLVRKNGKLPRNKIAHNYDLSYGVNTIELHKDDIKPGDKVLIVDDLLATGGTIQATIEMVERLGGKVVGLSFLLAREIYKNPDHKFNQYSLNSVIYFKQMKK